MCLSINGTAQIRLLISLILYIVVIQNNYKYGGSGYISQNIGTTSRNEAGSHVAVHELGHSLFELGDEYTSGSFTDDSPNCGNDDCDKFSDLVSSSAFNDVSCEIKACSDGNYRIGLDSIMRYLYYPVGDVNLRFTCCTYQALTKEMPDYCSKYEFSNGYLLSYCQNDYQGYGSGSYIENRVIESDRKDRYLLRNARFTIVEKPLVVSLDRAGDLVSIFSNNASQLFRISAVYGDFDSIDEAVSTDGVPSILQITATFESGDPQVLYLNTRVEVDIPPLSYSDSSDRIFENERDTLYVDADSFDIVIDAAQLGKSKLMSIESKVVDTRSMSSENKRKPKKKKKEKKEKKARGNKNKG